MWEAFLVGSHPLPFFSSLLYSGPFSRTEGLEASRPSLPSCNLHRKLNTASEEMCVKHSCTKQKRILYPKMRPSISWYLVEALFFSSVVLMRQEMGSWNFIEKLRVLGQITFGHVIKLALVPSSTVDTTAGLVLYFINRSQLWQLDWAPNQWDSASLIWELYFQRGKDFHKFGWRITCMSLKKPGSSPWLCIAWKHWKGSSGWRAQGFAVMNLAPLLILTIGNNFKMDMGRCMCRGRSRTT